MMISYIMWSMYFIGETLRRLGTTWSDYWNQLLVNIIYYPLPAKETSDTIRSRTTKYHARKRLLLLVLISSSSKSASVPNIYLSVERMLKMKLKKSRDKDGKLKICKLSDFGLHQVSSVLESLP